MTWGHLNTEGHEHGWTSLSLHVALSVAFAHLPLSEIPCLFFPVPPPFSLLILQVLPICRKNRQTPPFTCRSKQYAYSDNYKSIIISANK